MARRSGRPDRGRSLGDTAVLDTPQDDAVMEQRGRRRPSWGGSGGRWWLWVGRAVLWAFIIVVVVNGIRAPLERFTSSSPSSTSSGNSTSAAQSQFPSSAASAYALEFAQVYLNFDQRDQAGRAARLAYFLPPNSAEEGWDGFGSLSVTSLQVAGVEAKDANNGIVTVLVQTGGNWMQLAVPVYAKDGAMVIPNAPALLAPPPQATAPQRSTASDSALVTEVTQPLTSFFTAYGAGDKTSLSRYTLPGSNVSDSGLGNAVSFIQLGSITAPPGPADQRVVTATVTWQISGGKLDQTYDVTMVRQSGQWYVKDVRGATP